MSNTKTRKLSIVRTPTNPLRLEPGEAIHVDVDVHKASYSVALYSDGRGVLMTWVQPARLEILIERLRSVREGSPRSSTRTAPPASAWRAASGPRATRRRSLPRRSCSHRSAPRPRAIAWTAVGWPSSPPTVCSTRSVTRSMSPSASAEEPTSLSERAVAPSGVYYLDREIGGLTPRSQRTERIIPRTDQSTGVYARRSRTVRTRTVVRSDSSTKSRSGRVDLGGRPPRPPTDPGLHITRTRFLIS